jgi:hypothetical protein
MTEVCGILAASGRALPLGLCEGTVEASFPVRVLVNGVYLWNGFVISASGLAMMDLSFRAVAGGWSPTRNNPAKRRSKLGVVVHENRGGSQPVGATPSDMNSFSKGGVYGTRKTEQAFH